MATGHDFLDPYAVLLIPRTASKAEVKDAYRCVCVLRMGFRTASHCCVDGKARLTNPTPVFLWLPGASKRRHADARCWNATPTKPRTPP